MLATSYGLQLYQCGCVSVCVHKGDEGHERTCTSRTSANCSRAVAAVLLLPLPFFFLFLFSFCFCSCFSSCSSLCFCFCFAVLLLLPPSCTQLEAINFTCAQTMRQTVRQKERQGDKEKEREKTPSECWRKTRKMSKTIMSQKFPTL